PALVAAMKAGAKMTVQAISARGTNTSYDYSLSGVTAALNAIQDCK
ncbi:MAG: invasion associated locus B family protein, partial [Oricola sp.]|nr:invasion associated locus B family protein [Oricola sp.]